MIIPKLEEKHIFERLQWAFEHKHWIHKEWEAVIWSDEYSGKISDSGRRMRVFRQPPEKWFEDCIAQKQSANVFLSSFRVVFGAGTVEPSAFSLSNCSTRVSMSTLSSTF